VSRYRHRDSASRSIYASERRGFIRCYGLFWSVHEVNWFPRSDGGSFRLLGRRGKKSPSVCDFRPQTGIYVLYDEYGPYYVGLTRKQPIGDRLKQHHLDRHERKWERFSWFGFRPVLTAGRLSDGTLDLGKVPQRLVTDSRSTIGDIEALLIQSLGTQHRGNKHEEHFASALHWTQVMAHEAEDILKRLPKPPRSRARQPGLRRPSRSGG
jgi:hypothetical protein